MKFKNRLLKNWSFDLESFYPAKERFKLAISLNNLLASPGFTTGEGEPLDIQRLLYTPEGNPGFLSSLSPIFLILSECFL